MSFIKNLSIKAKLLSSFFIVIIVNLVILATSLNSIQNTQESAAQIKDILSSAFARVSSMQRDIQKIDSLFLRGLNPKDNSMDVENLPREYPVLLSNLLQTADNIRPGYLPDPEYRKNAERLKQDIAKIANIIEKDIRPLMRDETISEGFESYVLTVSPLVSDAYTCLTRLSRMQTGLSVQIAQNASNPALIYLNASLGLISTILAIILAFSIAAYISKSLDVFVRILNRLAKGDFTSKDRVYTQDEFGKALLVLDQMCESVASAIDRTKAECNEILNKIKHVQSEADLLAQHSNDIQTQVVTVAAASDEMVSTTQNIARNCENAAENSNKCKSITTDGLSMVKQAVDKIREQSHQTQDNAIKIENLSRQSNDIGSIISVIDDIAAQTNLLALNAAIEAARAGEAGRGFAVVADEVRALASRTASSTQEISRMIKNIQDEAKVATDSINTSVDNMNQVAENAEQVETLLNDIASHVTEVNNQVHQIATAADQQTSATSEISLNAQNVTNASVQMANSTSEQSETMNNAYKDITELNKVLNFFKTDKNN